MKIPLAKLKAILLYFCNNTDTKFLGKVKLMKLFYYLDFTHVKKYGCPVTYDTYVNLEHGPIPSFIKNIIDNASDNIHDSELADVINIDTPKGTEMKRILPQRELTDRDKSYFSETELNVLEYVCERFGNKNTKYIEDASHQEAPWGKTNYLQVIPYSLAVEDKQCSSTKEEIDFLVNL